MQDFSSLSLVGFNFKIRNRFVASWRNGKLIPCLQESGQIFERQKLARIRLLFTRNPRNCARFSTANITAICRRICTVPCKWVAQVKIGGVNWVSGSHSLFQAFGLFGVVQSSYRRAATNHLNAWDRLRLTQLSSEKGKGISRFHRVLMAKSEIPVRTC